MALNKAGVSIGEKTAVIMWLILITILIANKMEKLTMADLVAAEQYLNGVSHELSALFEAMPPNSSDRKRTEIAWNARIKQNMSFQSEIMKRVALLTGISNNIDK